MMANHPQVSAEDLVRITARAHERDRYLSALLAPRSVRADLIALAAFAGEVGRIPVIVTEPMMGRIRLQWWRERIETATGGGHPVADALLAMMGRNDLATDQLTDIIEAHETSLDDRPFADDAALLHYVDQLDGRLFAVAARIVGIPAHATFIRHAGRAYGLARVLIETPATLAHGRLLLPTDPGETLPVIEQLHLQPIVQRLGRLAREHLAATADWMHRSKRASRTPFLPLALVRPYLDSLERKLDQRTADGDLSPWQRVWRLWRCHRSGLL